MDVAINTKTHIQYLFYWDLHQRQGVLLQLPTVGFEQLEEGEYCDAAEVICFLILHNCYACQYLTVFLRLGDTCLLRRSRTCFVLPRALTSSNGQQFPCWMNPNIIITCHKCYNTCSHTAYYAVLYYIT